MKKFNYKFGTHRCHTYVKTAGKGFEVGFLVGKDSVFVGNFIHKKEATQWFSIMNKEIRTFSRRYWVVPTASLTWYRRFLTNSLYKSYYRFLDHHFNRYQRTYTTAFKKDIRRYQALKKGWNTRTTKPMHMRIAA